MLRVLDWLGELGGVSNIQQSWDNLVEMLVEGGILHSTQVIRALRIVSREPFLPDNVKPYAAVDTPLPIGSGQTISAPHG